MKKYLYLTLIITSVLYSEVIKMIPIEKKYLSYENGGTKFAIDAYSDGIGLVSIPALKNSNNSGLNKLVFTYGEQAKELNQNIYSYVLDNSTNQEDLNLVNKVLSNIPNGMPCNDNNIKTINDKYVTGICEGTNVEGQSCNDNNIQTINDKYLNGLCEGTNVEGQSCNDNNIKTINDKYVNGVCEGTNVEGQSCNDNNIYTYNDIYKNGICTGTAYINKVNKTYYNNGSSLSYTGSVIDYTNKVLSSVAATNKPVPCTLMWNHLKSYSPNMSDTYTVHIDGAYVKVNNACYYSSLSTSTGSNKCNTILYSSTPGSSCVATIGTSSKLYTKGCSSGWTLNGSTCTKYVCPTGYTDNGSNCEKTVNYNYYKYYCSAGYNPNNVGYTTYTKTDSNLTTDNTTILSTSVNNSTAPINNCSITVLECPTGYIFDGIGCKI